MASREEIEYASALTEIVHSPRNKLETFGATVVEYHVVTELMDSVSKVRIRQGRFHVERPRLITPTFYANQLAENFGEEAREYADQFSTSEEGMRILQYGLKFRKEEHNQQVVPGNLKEVADQIAEDLKQNEENFAGVIIGVDDLWEVSLVRFGIELIGASAPKNIRDLSQRGLMEGTANDVPVFVREEIESDFQNAGANRDRIHALGNKLRKYGLLEEYEDRFYGLVRNCR
ncbi:MAG: hypothetical protein R6V56_01615 [Lentisphaeria bacterium]